MADCEARESLRERKKKRTGDLILDVTAELLADRDISAVSVDEVAELAEVSRATVFNYFPTKADLVAGIADREISVLSEHADEQSRTGADPLRILEETMYRLAQVSFEAGPAGWQILRSLLDDPTDAGSPVWRLLQVIGRLIAAGKRNGTIRSDVPVDECSRLMFGAFVAELFAAAGGRRARELSRKEFGRASCRERV